MKTHRELLNERRRLDAQIQKAGKSEIKKIVKQLKLPASYLFTLAERVRNNPQIYS